MIIGDNWSKVEKSKEYFLGRHCFIDCRGELIIARSSNWGFNITVLTASHSIENGIFGEMIFKKVVVKRNAWIASNVVLYNCEIGESAIVSVGSVVANMQIEPFTMVEGNPAKVIKVFEGGEWKRV